MKILLTPLITLLCLAAHGQQTVGVFTNQEASFNGYTLLAPSAIDTAYLIDNCGFVVHKWVTNQRPGLSTYLLEDGNLLRTGKYLDTDFNGGGIGGLVEIYDWESDLLWSYVSGNDTLHQHHDIEIMSNGNVLIVNWGLKTNAQAIEAGFDPNVFQNDVWPTLITEIDPIFPDSGIMVWQWDLFDHLIQDLDPTKGNFGVVGDHPELLDANYTSNGNSDFLHVNAIDYNEEHDLIAICSRKSSEIYVIDHSTTTEEAASHSGGDRGKGGDFLYRWGNPQTYGRGTAFDQILDGPHDISWIPDSLNDAGKFLVFNNDGGSNGSAVNVFDPPTDGNGNYSDPGSNAFGPAAVDWHYEDPPEFLSATISGAQRLPNGNTLICEGSSGHIFEVNDIGVTLWDYVNPASANGNLSQGANPSQNGVFRAYRFPANHSAFEGKDLTPQNLIEIDSNPDPCEIVPELVGITETQSQDLKIWPNPTTGAFNLEVGELEPKPVLVFNSIGELMATIPVDHNNARISTSGWNKGLYLIRVGNRTERLILN